MATEGATRHRDEALLARAQAAREVLLYDPLTDGELLLSYVIDPPEGLEFVRRPQPGAVSTEGVERIFALAEWEDDDQPAHLSKRVLAGTTSRMPSRGADNERVVSS